MIRYAMRKKRRHRRGKKRRKIGPGINESTEPRQKRMKIVVVPMSMKKGADESSLLNIAVARNYPLAKKTASVHSAIRTAEFLFFSFDLLFSPILPAPPPCVISDNTKLGGNASCNVVSLTLFLQRLSLLRDRIDLPDYTKSPSAFREFCVHAGFSWDVFVCLSHRGLVHRCSEICTSFIQTRDSMVCPISLRRRAIMQVDEFEDVTVNGAKQSVRVTHIPLGRRKNGRRRLRKVFFRFDGRILSLGYDRMIQEVGDISTSIAPLLEMRRVVEKQKATYNRLIRKGVTSLETIVKHVNEPRKKEPMSSQSIVPKRRKNTRRRRKRRRNRRHVSGQFNRSSTEKMSVTTSSRMDQKFATKKREFVKTYRSIINYSAVRVINYTHVHKVIAASALRDKITVPWERPSTAESLVVNPIPPQWLVPWQKESICTLTKKPEMFYMQFMLNDDIKSVILRDMNKEFSLRSEIQPRLLDAPEEFRKGLAEKVRFIRKLMPGLFRIIVMIAEIEKESLNRFNTLRNILTKRHEQGKAIEEEDIWDLVAEYDYKRNYLHKTCSDNMILEIAELLYWAEITCNKHPMIDSTNTTSTEITREMIFVGTLFHTQLGLSIGDIDLIPKDIVICNRNVLVPQNTLGQVNVDRQNVTKGMRYVKDILVNLCNILPIEEVSFMLWKEKHSVLVPLEEFGEESLIK